MAIANRLKKNFKHLSKWARKNQIEAYRIYDRDIPEYPFSIDVYKDKCIAYYWQSSVDEEKDFQWPDTQSGLLELGFKEEDIFLKVRAKQKGNNQYQKISRDSQEVIIQEHQAKLKINLTDYLDSGLFLDHRPLRQMIFEEAKDKRFLNLFCYTGSVSVFAALAGAKTTSVDMSAKYIDWARENFAINDINLNGHYFLQENCIDYLENCSETFDLIFLDPPTFSNSKKMEKDFEVQRDHVTLIKNCMALLAKGGQFYFSNNRTDFVLSEEITQSFQVKDLTHQSIPQDFKNKKIHKLYLITHL